MFDKKWLLNRISGVLKNNNITYEIHKKDYKKLDIDLLTTGPWPIYIHHELWYLYFYSEGVDEYSYKTEYKNTSLKHPTIISKFWKNVNWLNDGDNYVLYQPIVHTNEQEISKVLKDLIINELPKIEWKYDFSNPVMKRHIFIPDKIINFSVSFTKFCISNFVNDNKEYCNDDIMYDGISCYFAGPITLSIKEIGTRFLEILNWTIFLMIKYSDGIIDSCAIEFLKTLCNEYFMQLSLLNKLDVFFNTLDKFLKQEQDLAYSFLEKVQLATFKHHILKIKNWWLEINKKRD